ncbi:hypothetical protein V8G54_014488 [Vigna mungo]|uniref:SnoaL-like domain-containing protein n=1 Tax=Vigna mungo TaxID=3915 RepID=A0AAQ3NJF9_VIGMU
MQINIGKEGEAALSRWWELGSMPAILCYSIRFLSSQRMTTSAFKDIGLLFLSAFTSRSDEHVRIRMLTFGHQFKSMLHFFVAVSDSAARPAGCVYVYSVSYSKTNEASKQTTTDSLIEAGENSLFFSSSKSHRQKILVSVSCHCSSMVIFGTSCHWLGIDSNITKRLDIRFPSSRTKCSLYSDKIEIKRHTINNNVMGKYWGRNRILAMASKRDPNSQQNSLSSAETVDQYFTSINGKDLRQLDECISEDACFEDYAFTKPFQGKKEVMRFLQQLTECMGRNVKFRVKHIYEGDDLTAAANWHMGHISFQNGKRNRSHSQEVAPSSS